MATTYEVTSLGVDIRKLATGDRVWFQRKPGRKYRVRAPVDGEVDPVRIPPLPPGAMPAIAVRKCAPKVRHRLYGFIEAGRYPHTEADAKRIFDAMAQMMARDDPDGMMRAADGIAVACEMLKEPQD